LTITGSGNYVDLVDLINNGNRSSAEALYVDSLYVGAGATLDLNDLQLYVLLGGSPHLVYYHDPNFGPGDIVPIPPSAMLLGSGLLGLALWGRKKFRRG
jgi:hypothetical protein